MINWFKKRCRKDNSSKCNLQFLMEKLSTMAVDILNFPHICDMADNFLEKRYEEVFGSRSRAAQLPRRPSLDSLLSRTRTDNELKPDYPVNAIQAEAVAAAGKQTDGVFSFETRPEGRLQRIIPSCGDVADREMRFGAVLLAMRLKAAELGLGSRKDSDPVSIIIGKEI